MNQRLVEIANEIGIDIEASIEEVLDCFEIELAGVNKRLLRKPDDESLKTKYALLQEGIDLLKVSENETEDKMTEGNQSDLIDTGLMERELKITGLTEQSLNQTGLSEEEINAVLGDKDEVSDQIADNTIPDNGSMKFTGEQELDWKLFNVLVDMYNSIVEVRTDMRNVFLDMSTYIDSDTISFFYGNNTIEIDKKNKAASDNYLALEKRKAELNSYLDSGLKTILEQFASDIIMDEIPEYMCKKAESVIPYLHELIEAKMGDYVPELDVQNPELYCKNNDYGLFFMVRNSFERNDFNAVRNYISSYASDSYISKFAKVYRGAVEAIEVNKYTADEDMVNGFMDAYFALANSDVLDWISQNTKWLKEGFLGDDIEDNLKHYTKYLYYFAADQRGLHSRFPRKELAYVMENYLDNNEVIMEVYRRNLQIDEMKKAGDIVGLIQQYRSQNEEVGLNEIMQIYEKMDSANKNIIYEALKSDASEEERPVNYRLKLYHYIMELVPNIKTGIEADRENFKLLVMIAKLNSDNEKEIRDLNVIVTKYLGGMPSIGEGFFSSLVKDGYAEGAVGLAIFYRDGYPVRDLERAKELAFTALDTVYEKKAESILDSINAEISAGQLLERYLEALDSSRNQEALVAIHNLANNKDHIKSAYLLGKWYEEGMRYIDKDLDTAAKYYAMALLYSRGRYKNLSDVVNSNILGKRIEVALADLMDTRFAKKKTMAEYRDILANSYGWED